jgi:hypothetical protein
MKKTETKKSRATVLLRTQYTFNKNLISGKDHNFFALPENMIMNLCIFDEYIREVKLCEIVHHVE